MESNILTFKSQVQALRDGKFTYDAARIVVDFLRAKVDEGQFTWAELETSIVELDSLLIKLRFKSAG